MQQRDDRDDRGGEGAKRHFFAIGWRHRADYRAAGFKLLPAIDPTGATTAAWSFLYAALLVPVSLTPWALGSLGGIYGVTAALAGGVFLWRTRQFTAAASDRDPAARRLFFASIIYLPILLSALVLDRLVSL